MLQIVTEHATHHITVLAIRRTQKFIYNHKGLPLFFVLTMTLPCTVILTHRMHFLIYTVCLMFS